MTGNKTTQLRGGLGIFTSRVPWVWPGGMFIRNGLNSSLYGSFLQPDFADPFYARPQEWRDNLFNSNSPSGDVDLFVENFKYPQVFRTNIAVDQALPLGLVGSAEFMYTKTLNNIDVKNVNLKPAVGNLEGADNRPVFNVGDEIDDRYSFISLVGNTNQGYTWNTTLKLEKPVIQGFEEVWPTPLPGPSRFLTVGALSTRPTGETLPALTDATTRYWAALPSTWAPRIVGALSYRQSTLASWLRPYHCSTADSRECLIRTCTEAVMHWSTRQSGLRAFSDLCAR